MARANASLQRLYVEADLSAGAVLAVADQQAHYLRNVLRLEPGAALLVFNGRHGEWLARIATLDKKSVTLAVESATRAQDTPDDIWLLVAPVKKNRLDYLAQKATEMGATRLVPVITQRTQGKKGGVKLDKLRANAIEAAEQCNILSLPEIAEVEKLSVLLADWPDDRKLVFCDEMAASGTGIDQMEMLKGSKLAVLIGPEGGFEDAERDAIMALPQTVGLSLGPRILRSDTAVVAALAVLQNALQKTR